MPAKSEAQQRFMGMALAAKRGKGRFSKKVMEAAESMSEKQLKDFAKTKHEGLPDKKAYLEGFMKRAAEYGYSESEISEAVKLAEEGWGDLDVKGYAGNFPVITSEHNSGIIPHLKRNAGKYIGAGLGIPLAAYINSTDEGYVPGTASAATSPLLLGSLIDDVRERKHIENKLKESKSLEHLRNVVSNRANSLQALQGGIDEDLRRFSDKTAGALAMIKEYMKKHEDEPSESILKGFVKKQKEGLPVLLKMKRLDRMREMGRKMDEK
jgi:hypothetical protein